MPDFAALRRAFSLREDLIWLNNCGVSVPPRSSADAVCQYLEAFMASGVLQRVKPHAALKNKIQSYLAKFLGGKPHNYALLNNTAEGMTFIAQSLPLNAGDAILLVEREYPSNVYPFLQLQKNGVTVRFVAPGFSNEEFIHNIKQAITPKVRAMALSAVDWLTGLKFDLARIGALLKEHGIFFLLDAAQGAGHVSIGVQELKVDAMAFSCWKWLLGPLGSGALYVSDDFMAKLDIRVAGTSSVKNDEQYLPYREDYKETAERFMLSTAPYLNWVFLENSLAFLDSIGLDAVMVRLMELAEQLTTILRNAGWEILRDRLDQKSAIVCARPAQACDMAKLHATLLHKGIVCALREGYLRFSPHLNVAEEDLVQFARVVEDIPLRS